MFLSRHYTCGTIKSPFRNVFFNNGGGTLRIFGGEERNILPSPQGPFVQKIRQSRGSNINKLGHKKRTLQNLYIVVLCQTQVDVATQYKIH